MLVVDPAHAHHVRELEDRLQHVVGLMDRVIGIMATQHSLDQLSALLRPLAPQLQPFADRMPNYSATAGLTADEWIIRNVLGATPRPPHAPATRVAPTPMLATPMLATPLPHASAAPVRSTPAPTPSAPPRDHTIYEKIVATERAITEERAPSPVPPKNDDDDDPPGDADRPPRDATLPSSELRLRL
jgi:hypothetical protein